MKYMKHITSGALAAIMIAGSANAQMVGNYTRNSDDGPQTIVVQIIDDKLFCTRESDGFEMCHGLVLSDDARWRGRTMKHPDMPRFMTFNGTASFSETQMNLRGCAMGICDAETWDKQ